MADYIRIETDQVLEIADELEALNKKLKNQLEDSKVQINNLKNIWEGQAATETVNNYNAFANEYFDSYEAVISEYCKFLRDNVAAGYVRTENYNVQLSEAFK